MQATTPAQEQVIWHGSSSQWLNFKTFILSILGAFAIVALFTVIAIQPTVQRQGLEGAVTIAGVALLAIPIFIVVRSFLIVKLRQYTLTTERVRVATGVFARRTDELELYRVDDTLLLEPFLLRVVRRGNVVMITSDPTSPKVVLEAVPGASVLRDQLRHYREICRDRKRTQVVDFVNDSITPQ